MAVTSAAVAEDVVAEVVEADFARGEATDAEGAAVRRVAVVVLPARAEVARRAMSAVPEIARLAAVATRAAAAAVGCAQRGIPLDGAGGLEDDDGVPRALAGLVLAAALARADVAAASSSRFLLRSAWRSCSRRLDSSRCRLRASSVALLVGDDGVVGVPRADVGLVDAGVARDVAVARGVGARVADAGVVVVRGVGERVVDTRGELAGRVTPVVARAAVGAAAAVVRGLGFGGAAAADGLALAFVALDDGADSRSPGSGLPLRPPGGSAHAGGHSPLYSMLSRSASAFPRAASEAATMYSCDSSSVDDSRFSGCLRSMPLMIRSLIPDWYAVGSGDTDAFLIFATRPAMLNAENAGLSAAIS